MIEGGQVFNGAGGVATLNLLSGALSLIGGTNVTITTVDANTIRIDATAGGAGLASINTSTIGAQTLVSSDTDILTIVTNVGTGETVFSLITGTEANNLLQLNEDAQLPAIDIGELGLVINPVTALSDSLNVALSDMFAYIPYGVKQKSTNYTMVASDNIIEVEDNSLVFTLPDATTATVGKPYSVNNSDVVGTSVIPPSGQFINGALTTWSISMPYNGANFYTNGTGWRTI